MKRMIVATALLLGGCGSAQGLKPAPGQQLPVAPYGADATPTPDALLVPGPQARPQRSGELLRSSQRRPDDEFDLPPQ